VDPGRLVSSYALLQCRSDIDVDDPYRYVLIALSEIFASITGLEYAFTKAPRNMRSLVMSMFLFTSAVAAAIGEAFVCASISFPLPLVRGTSDNIDSSLAGSVTRVELCCQRYPCRRWWDPVLARRQEA
jgi:hypothetical protein